MSKKTAKKATKSAKAKKAAEPKAKKVGALDAAAQVLAGSKEPMNCKALIEAIAKRGLWTSPAGKTPHATLYSAISQQPKCRPSQILLPQATLRKNAGGAIPRRFWLTGACANSAGGRKAPRTERFTETLSSAILRKRLWRQELTEFESYSVPVSGADALRNSGRLVNS